MITLTLLDLELRSKGLVKREREHWIKKNIKLSSQEIEKIRFQKTHFGSTAEIRAICWFRIRAQRRLLSQLLLERVIGEIKAEDKWNQSESNDLSCD